MRVTTLQSSQGPLTGIEARQAEQARLQLQLGTGLRVNSPGDDPVAAAHAEMARSRLTRAAQDQRTTQLAASLLSSAEVALGQGVNLLQSVRESLVAAGSGVYSATDRQALAEQLRSAREGLLALANTRNGAGSFVFAGQGSAAEPLTGGANPAYGATPGVQSIGKDGRFSVTVDGRSSFMSVPQGNGVFVTASGAGNTGEGWVDAGSVTDPAALTGHDYRITIGGTPGSLTYDLVDVTTATSLATGVALPPDGTIEVDGQRVKIAGAPAAGDTFDLEPATPQSIFKTLDEAIAALEQPLGAGAYSERLVRAQASLDRALDRLIITRSHVGEEMRRVEDAEVLAQQEGLQATERRSDLEDLDYARGISQLQANQFALEAALKSYASTARTSLFQLIG